MLSDVLTFFYDRSKKRVVEQFPTGTDELTFFVSGIGQLPRIKNNEEFDTYRGRVRNGPGALVVTVFSNRVRFSKVDANRFSVPDAVFILPIGGRARRCDLDWTKRDLEVEIHPGEHILTPVDSAAQAKLSEFLDYLRHLPGDYESSMLNLLLRPSLEWRVSRIEDALKARASAQDKSLLLPQMRHEELPRRSSLRRSRPLEMPIWIAAVVAFIFVALGAAGVWSYGKFRGNGQNEKGQSEAEIKSWQVSSEPDESKVYLVQKAYQQLLEAMAKSSQPEVKTLYKTHALNSANWSSDKAALAVIKLELLRNGDIKENSADLKSINQLDDTVAQLNNKAQEMYYGQEMWQDQNVPNVLGFFSCIAFGRAEVPYQSQSVRIAGSNCKTDIGRVSKGLQDLTGWVAQKSAVSAPRESDAND